MVIAFCSTVLLTILVSG